MTDAADLRGIADRIEAVDAEMMAMTNTIVELRSQLARLQTGPTSRTWGVAGNSADILSNTNQAVGAAKALNAEVLRVDFDWSVVEKVKGSYNWTRLDALVAGCSAVGIRVLATVAYTPVWARPTGTTNKVPPTNVADFTNFVSACVRRYAPLGVKWWEIWNEPNIVQFWQPKPEPTRYTSMLKASYVAVKTIDPDAVVLNGGLSPAADALDGTMITPRTFLTRMYIAGARGYFDALAVHPYCFPYGVDKAADWNQWYSLPQTRQILVDHDDMDLKVWATEYGAPTGTSAKAVSEEVQATFVTDAWREWTAWPWAGPLLWYCLRDTGTDPSNREHNFGLYRNDWSAKLAAGAFKSLP